MNPRNGIGGTNHMPINSDDLVADIARARDSATGDMKKLLKRCGRRIEKYEIAMQDVAARIAQTLPGVAEDDER